MVHEVRSVIFQPTALESQQGSCKACSEGDIMTINDRILNALRSSTGSHGIGGFIYQSAPAFLNATDVQGNVNYSPVSLWIALAIASQGAKNRTLEQLQDALGLTGLSDADYRSLIQSINQQQPCAKSVMETHSSIWIENAITPLPSFITTVSNAFDAQIETVDFADPATGMHISDWIASHTAGLLRPSITTDSNDRLSIVNTMFADGRWEDPFEEENTTTDVFHGERGDADVPFMHGSQLGIPYLCDETFGWQRVDLPFDDGSELRIILPDQGHFGTIVSDAIALRRAISTEWESAVPEQDKRELIGMDRLKAKLAARKEPERMPIYANKVWAHISLPRFEISSTFQKEQIITALQSLGIQDAFNPNAADFSRIYVNPLVIGSIIQSTRIEVNEHGAKAVAYTMVLAPAGAPPQLGDEITFTVDRPFLYALVTRDGLPLFVGAVRNL